MNTKPDAVPVQEAEVRTSAQSDEVVESWFVERFHNVPGLTTEWFNRFRQDVDDLKARLRAGEK